MQPQRAARVAEPAPGPHRLAGGRGRQRLRRRPAIQPGGPRPADPLDRRLLQHELADHHRPRRGARTAPGQIAGVVGVPVRTRPTTARGRRAGSASASAAVTRATVPACGVPARVSREPEFRLRHEHRAASSRPGARSDVLAAPRRGHRDRGRGAGGRRGPDRQRDQQRIRRPGRPVTAAGGRPDPATGTPSPTATPSPTPSAGARVSASTTPATASPAATPSAPRRPPRSPTPTPTPEPVTCAADTLRPTLTGKQRLQVKERSTFTLSLINGSGQTCTATVNPDNFELGSTPAATGSGAPRTAPPWSSRSAAPSRPSRRWSGS